MLESQLIIISSPIMAKDSEQERSESEHRQSWVIKFAKKCGVFHRRSSLAEVIINRFHVV